MSTGVTEVETKEVEEMHQAVKYYSFFVPYVETYFLNNTGP